VTTSDYAAGALPLRRHRRLRIAFYALVMTIGLATSFYPTFLSGFRRMQPDAGDPMLNNYILEHEYRVFTDTRYRFPLWSPPFFYPEKNVLAYGDNLFAGEPLYALLRLGCGPAGAFQLWAMVVLVADFFAFLYAARKLRIGPPLAAFGAYLFAFGVPRAAQFNHPQLLLNMFSPIALLLTWRFLLAPSRRLIAGSALAFYLQILAGYYLGWMLLLGASVFVGAVLAFDRETRRRAANFFHHHGRFALLLACGWTAALWVLMRPYWEAMSFVGPRSWRDVANFLPHAWSWLSVQSGGLYARWLHPPRWAPAPWEQYLFLGFAFWIVAALSLGFIARRSSGDRNERVLVVASWATFLVLFLLSLRIPGRIADLIPGSRTLLSSTPSLWRIVYAVVPGARAIRAVSRIWTAAYLFLLAGALLGADRWIHRRIAHRRARQTLVAALLIAGMVEQWNSRLPSFRKADFFGRAAAAANFFRSRGCSIGRVEPDPMLPWYTGELVGMWAGLEAGIPVVNGYSGNIPPGYPSKKGMRNPRLLKIWLGKSMRDDCVVAGSPTFER